MDRIYIIAALIAQSRRKYEEPPSERTVVKATEASFNGSTALEIIRDGNVDRNVDGNVNMDLNMDGNGDRDGNMDGNRDRDGNRDGNGDRDGNRDVKSIVASHFS